MNFVLIYSPEALSDLDRIWMEVFEASQSVSVADRYLADLRDAIRKKRAFPRSGGRLQYGGEFTGIYFVPFKSYLAFYRVRKNLLEVGRVLFARSDYMKTLFGEEAAHET